MRKSQVKELLTGDQVYWNDPDADLCSRVYTILTIEWIDENVVRIVDPDGTELEALISELE